MSLEKKFRYPQPYSIKIEAENEAVREHWIQKLHHRAKYDTKYRRSKQSRRLYSIE
jgi:hypothetical protein